MWKVDWCEESNCFVDRDGFLKKFRVEWSIAGGEGGTEYFTDSAALSKWLATQEIHDVDFDLRIEQFFYLIQK